MVGIDVFLFYAFNHVQYVFKVTLCKNLVYFFSQLYLFLQLCISLLSWTMLSPNLLLNLCSCVYVHYMSLFISLSVAVFGTFHLNQSISDLISCVFVTIGTTLGIGMDRVKRNQLYPGIPTDQGQKKWVPVCLKSHLWTIYSPRLLFNII